MFGHSKKLVSILAVLLVAGCGYSTGDAPSDDGTTAPGSSDPGGGGGPSTPASYKDVAVGENHSCGLTTAGGVRCWGENTHGQLGNGTTTDSSTPVTVSGSDVFTQISVGRDHTCGLTNANLIKCWGDGGGGQIGDGTFASSSVPTTSGGLQTYVAVGAGSLHTCGLRADDTVLCWGFNTYGQLGNNASGGPPLGSPVAAHLVNDAVQLSVGPNHVCVKRSGGGLLCWGDNSNHQFGTVATSKFPDPTGMTSTNVAKVMSNGDHNCIIKNDASTQCWGRNTSGELGTGATSTSQDPIAITGGFTFTALAPGYSHTCGLLADGSAKCWGDNTVGELGCDVSYGTYSYAPAPVTGGTTFTKIAAGFDYTCAVTSAQTIKCWGENGHGQLGDGTTNSSLQPVDVSN